MDTSPNPLTRRVDLFMAIPFRAIYSNGRIVLYIPTRLTQGDIYKIKYDFLPKRVPLNRQPDQPLTEMIVVNFAHDLSVDRKGEVRSPCQDFQLIDSIRFDRICSRPIHEVRPLTLLLHRNRKNFWSVMRNE